MLVGVANPSNVAIPVQILGIAWIDDEKESTVGHVHSLKPTRADIKLFSIATHHESQVPQYLYEALGEDEWPSSVTTL
jgi:hypothetical protein